MLYKKTYRGKNPLPQELLDRHPDLTKKDVKLIATVILAVRADKIRRGYILDFFVPHLGQFKSHGSKKVRRYNKNKARDKKRKQITAKEKALTKESLLW